MGKFSLENIIKERLKGHEVHVDKRELWRSLGIEDEEKDRKALWLWWFGGLVGIALVGGLWWHLQKDGLDLPNIQEAKAIAVEESVAKTGNETISETSTSELLSNIIEEVKSQESESINSENEENNTNETNTIISNQTNIKSNTLNSTGDLNSGASMDQGSEKSGLLANEKPAVGTIINGDLKSEEANEKEELISELINIDKLPYYNAMLFYEREMGTLAVDVNPLIKPIEPSRKFEFELYGGAGPFSRTISVDSLDGFVSARDSLEAPIEHVSLGVSLKYMIGGGFYSKLGLSVNRWNEKYSYNFVSDSTFTTVEVPDVILIDLQGNLTTTYTTGVETTINTVYWVRYNRLTQIDLPISLGYERRMNRWSIFGEATGILNLKQQFSGYLNTEEGLETKDPDIFKSRIGLNLGLNAGVGYGITPRLRARLSARYYRSLSSVLLPSTGVEQRYSSLGLRAGLGYLF